MKELYATTEMQKFQDSARKTYTEKKVLDLDAVYMGWKIATGRVLYGAEQNVTVTLLAEPQKHLFDVQYEGAVNQKGQLNIKQIANLILNNKVVVYYAK